MVKTNGGQMSAEVEEENPQGKKRKKEEKREKEKWLV